MEWIEGRVPSVEEIRAERAICLQREMKEPTFDQAVFDAEFPPVPGSEDVSYH